MFEYLMDIEEKNDSLVWKMKRRIKKFAYKGLYL